MTTPLTPPVTTPAAVPRLDPVLQHVLARVRLRARRRATWLHTLWAEEAYPNRNSVVTPGEVLTALDDHDDPATEANWYATSDVVAPWNEELGSIEAALLDLLRDGATAEMNASRFVLLHAMFGLSAADSDILQAALAVAVDPSLARVYAYLQDHAARDYATDYLIARLFERGRCCVWHPDSPLHRWRIVTERDIAPSEPPCLVLDRVVRDWLLGKNSLDERLVGLATVQPVLADLADWPVDAIARRMADAIGGAGTPQRVTVIGPPGSGRKTLAANVSARLGLPALVIDSDHIADADWDEVFVRAQRQAFLDRSALVWTGDAVLLRAWPTGVPYFPAQFVIAEPGQAPRAIAELVDQHITLPVPSLAERYRLWHAYLPELDTWPPAEVDALIARHRVSVGEIARLAQGGVDGPQQAAAFVRESRRQQLDLAQPLECPFTWDDLVVGDHPHAVLEDFVFEAHDRAQFWEQPEARRLFPQGRGLVGLFSGPPGTGKTMAAQVIAASLEIDLFRIDLSAVVSKYVGETSQNLQRILSRAERMDIVLLFDEADALFGKRTEIKDAHDRFANTDTNFLLQALESYGGISILATNKKSNMDQAFIRRIRYVLEFPKPDAEQRLRIWRNVVGELAGLDALDELAADLALLAESVDVTGAQIKYAVLAAVFAARRDARPLDLSHLMRGLDRELVKEGRTLSDRERARLSSNGW
jgi:MoxR-like ATPase